MRIAKYSLVWLLSMSVITGCLSSNGRVDAPKLTVEEISKALQMDGIELFPVQVINDDLVLNKVKPYKYTIGKPTEDVAYLEQISIYVFDSDNARKKGLDEFNQFLEVAKLATISNLFEQKNILLVYWQNPPNNKFGEQIKKVLQNL